MSRSNVSAGGGDVALLRPPYKPTPLFGSTTQIDYAQAFYTFRSRPKKVVNPRMKYRNNIEKPRGAHDYFNVMWDPHVFHGHTYQFHGKSTHPALMGKRGGGLPLGGECEPGGPTRLPRLQQPQKPSKKWEIPKCKLGGVERPETPYLHPFDAFNSIVTQTDQFLQEITGEAPMAEICTQTDAIHESPIADIYIQAKSGLDAGVQVDPCELFDFDTEVSPIVATMAAKILEQALLEVMEEEELQALREQQREFEELRRQEFLKLTRLKEREDKYQEDKRRLEYQLEAERLEEEETSRRVACMLFSTSYLRNLKQQAIQGLEADGVLLNSRRMFELFVPWLNEAVEQEVRSRKLCCHLLDDVIRSVAGKCGAYQYPEQTGTFEDE